MAQPRLDVKAKSTNELEFTLNPIVPGGYYEIMARSNSPDAHWIGLLGVIGESNQTAIANFKSDAPENPKTSANFKISDLGKWTLIAVVGADSDGDGLSDNYEELVTHTDPYFADTGNLGTPDGYRDPDGDNWSNLDEVSKGTDPLRWNPPDVPGGFSARFFTNNTVILTWSHWGGTLPDYFVIERADRSLRPPPNRSPTNRPPANRFYGRRPDDLFTTSEYQTVAKIFPKSDLHDYKYVVTNVDTLPQPLFRIRSHYTPPTIRVPIGSDSKTIRQTIREVSSRATTNGFDLVIIHPVPQARYLLLSRTSAKSQWRASGYFIVPGTNANLQLHVDSFGMMSGAAQRPTPLPDVRFVETSARMEFTCGSGEDSDGDGLPDIYEVLVSRTDPSRSISIRGGVLDGFADPDGDGWPNVEEFYRRTDPLSPNPIPKPVELKNPTAAELEKIFGSQPKTDLPLSMRAEIRKSGSSKFEPLLYAGLFLQSVIYDSRTNKALLNFELRIISIPPSRLGRPPEEAHGP